MKTQTAICIKSFNDGIELIEDKEYDVSINDCGSLLLFHKTGWYTLEEWEEFLKVL